jgi:uncharacterized repeat protein (TIGR03837 family)
MAHPAPAQPATWDIWCRVIDNHGDLGVCWRLARGLADRGLRVRLFVDDATALVWMAPDGAAGVTVWPWSEQGPWPEAGDVVMEAFGCDPPDAVVAAMSQHAQPPVWLNLEYLSAEPYVERSHRLPSPQRGGLTKWFFYPGFTARTGGLLREPGLLARRAVFDGAAWLAQQGWARRPDERVVSLFCYDNPAMPALLQRLAEQPTLLLATPGPAQRALAAARQAGPWPARLRVQALPWLAQPAYDHLLWACDLNFVRGEDSLVRALWAGAPFVWHIYPQHDVAHAAKLQALLQQMQAPADVATWIQAWNGLGPRPGALPPWPDGPLWQRACDAWQAQLSTQDDLVTQLMAFVHSRSGC